MSICVNSRPMTKMKKMLKSGAKLHKTKSLKPIKGVIEKNHKSND
jgi:hypothetical protein